MNFVQEKEEHNRTSESGNVLFLILIAVALFAALSYAVTSSTRGGGDANSETSLISSAQLTQYPATIRTSVVRMIIGGADVSQLEFNAPADFDDCTAGNDLCVFHPSGGGATFADAPGEFMDNGNPGTWVFNAENQIDLLGTSTGDENPTANTADVIAFLPGITQTLCNKVNEELGLPSTPPTESAIDIAQQMINTDGSTPAGICNGGCQASGTIGTGASAGEDLEGQPFGCFNQGGTFVYYHVLVER